MNLLNKIKFHVKEMKEKRSKKFIIYRLLTIINRRIPIPNEVYLKHMSFYDEIRLEKYLNPSNNLDAIDIGANYGLWTLRYTDNYKGVHSFEPNPNTFRLLKKNTRKLSNVELYCCALGEKNSVGDFLMHKSVGRNGFVIKRNDYIRTIKVPIKSLDSFGFKDVGLIKIDTEGFELPILMGSINTLEREKPQLFIEIHKKDQEIPIFNLLKELNYEYLVFKIRLDDQIIIITK